jgi:hypothetical protein
VIHLAWHFLAEKAEKEREEGRKEKEGRDD